MVLLSRWIGVNWKRVIPQYSCVTYRTFQGSNKKKLHRNLVEVAYNTLKIIANFLIYILTLKKVQISQNFALKCPVRNTWILWNDPKVISQNVSSVSTSASPKSDHVHKHLMTNNKMHIFQNNHLIIPNLLMRTIFWCPKRATSILA